MDEGQNSGRLTSTWLIHLPQPVSPIPSLLPVLFPASLFSIKCQDWPFYNHICDLGSGIQMQSMSIRIMGLLIERGEMVWGSVPILILTKYWTHNYTAKTGIWIFLSTGYWYFTGSNCSILLFAQTRTDRIKCLCHKLKGFFSPMHVLTVQQFTPILRHGREGWLCSYYTTCVFHLSSRKYWFHVCEPFKKSALVQREKTQNARESLKRELMKSKELALCALLHVIVMVH